jgi:hypothetical protein
MEIPGAHLESEETAMACLRVPLSLLLSLPSRFLAHRYNPNTRIHTIIHASELRPLLVKLFTPLEFHHLWH